jgi:hypothetical protein
MNIYKKATAATRPSTTRLRLVYLVYVYFFSESTPGRYGSLS